jgi:hypothetical protein
MTSSRCKMPRRRTSRNSSKTAKAYDHKETEAILRPDVGIQAQFPFWDPLRGDPRFEKIVQSLAPKQ